MKQKLLLYAGYLLFSLLLLWISFRIYAWAGLVPACVVIFIIFTSPEFAGNRRRKNLFRELPSGSSFTFAKGTPEGPFLSLQKFQELEQAEKEFSEAQKKSPVRRIVFFFGICDIAFLLICIRFQQFFPYALAGAVFLSIILLAELFRIRRKIYSKYKTVLPLLTTGTHISREIDSLLEKRPAFDPEKYASFWENQEDFLASLKICDLCVEVMRYPGDVFFYPQDSFRVMRFNRGRRLNDVNFQAWLEELFHVKLEKDDFELLDKGTFQDAVHLLKKTQTSTT